ncbi:SHC-transforming protein 2 [Rhinopithecus roxellana]|uniref:SHC-transforming protein 2 n=1 Tax=Rhinopithecus roxellana TaxID=61622 RepID=UPI0012379AB6|nr:SHC-transforming protein 2 [Rhinopithecus roxellana]
MTQGPGGRAPPAPPAPPEPEAPTTFCALLPRMPQWKFAAPSGFLGRGPAAARAAGASGGADPQSEPAGPGGVPALAAAVLGACEPRCAAPCPLPALSRCRGAGARGPRGARGAAGSGDAAAAAAAAAEWIRKGSFIHKPAHGWLHPDARVLGPGVSYVVRYMGCIERPPLMLLPDFNNISDSDGDAGAASNPALGRGGLLSALEGRCPGEGTLVGEVQHGVGGSVELGDRKILQGWPLQPPPGSRELQPRSRPLDARSQWPRRLMRCIFYSIAAVSFAYF